MGVPTAKPDVVRGATRRLPYAVVRRQPPDHNENGKRSNVGYGHAFLEVFLTVVVTAAGCSWLAL